MRETTENYFKDLENLKSKFNFIFINFDETPIYDMTGDHTYDEQGKKEITLRSHTRNQHRATVSLCITSEEIA